MTRLRVLVLLATAVLAAGTAAPATAQVQAAIPPSEPIITWAASADFTLTRVTNQTVRNVMRTSVGGRGLQVSLSNAHGSSPVTFNAVSVGIALDDGGVKAASLQPATFGGSPSVTVPPGGEVLSDYLRGFLHPGTAIAVSVYVEGDIRRATGHNLALTETYLSTPGNHTLDADAASYPSSIDSWVFVESLVVTRGLPLSTVAALGDSITDGVGSTFGADNRWTDYLAERILQRPSTAQAGIANEGISGNRVLSGGFGQSALTRFDRDVLNQPGVETVVLLEGINDINTGASATELIEGYRELIARAHADDTCIVGGTLTPNEGGDAGREAQRQAVNDFVRASGEFDGVIDFDAAVRDPSNPRLFLPAYDSGDGLHPSDAGYAAMAAAVPLRVLSCDR